jgi:hypothetical protein
MLKLSMIDIDLSKLDDDSGLPSPFFRSLVGHCYILMGILYD